MFDAAVEAAQPASRPPGVLARAVERVWPGPLTGLVVTRYGHPAPRERIEVVEAAHPPPHAAGAAARCTGLPLYGYVGGTRARLLPVPMMNSAGGGVYADDSIAFQAFMITPVGAATPAEAVRIGSEVFHTPRVAPADAGEEGLAAPSPGRMPRRVGRPWTGFHAPPPYGHEPAPRAPAVDPIIPSSGDGAGYTGMTTMSKFSRLTLTAALLGAVALPAFAQGTATPGAAPHGTAAHGTATPSGVPHPAQQRHGAGTTATIGAGSTSTTAPAAPSGLRPMTPAPSGKPAASAAGPSGTGASGAAGTGVSTPAAKAPSATVGQAPASAGATRAN